MSDPDELSPEQAAVIAAALVAAQRPSELSPQRHERILRAALEDPLAPPSATELEAAEQLRAALETGGVNEEAALARALTLAVGKGEPAPAAAAARALERAAAARPRANVVFVSFGLLSSALAVAAAIALVLKPVQETPTPRQEPPALSRSLGPVIGPDAGELSASERMDRIASARARDLRENRYLAWGVPR